MSKRFYVIYNTLILRVNVKNQVSFLSWIFIRIFVV